MIQTVLSVHRQAAGDVVVYVGTREWVPGRRVPRTIQRPWQHRFELPRELSDKQILDAVTEALHRLASVPQ